jgi:hypothetical protein
MDATATDRIDFARIVKAHINIRDHRQQLKKQFDEADQQFKQGGVGAPHQEDVYQGIRRGA